MQNLNRMIIFHRVADLGSFTEAAKELKMAKSAVSRHINLLEKQVGARLLNRTTRQLNLTEVGKIYFQSCQRIIDETQFMENEISVLQNQPKGSLKVAATNSIGNTYIAPLIVEFMRLYPHIKIDFMLQDQVVDMLEEAIDVSIRVGWLKDSNLVAKKITDSRMVLLASPSYIKKYSPVSTPKELENHQWVICTLLSNPTEWVFKHKKQTEKVTVKGNIKTNNAQAVKNLLLAGAGISVLTHFMVAEELKEGRLVELLPGYDLGLAGVYLVYQERQYRQLKIQLFSDFISKNLKLG
ncbi:MAG: LysR family transcriptional regulator [Cycloclasticus sp.]|uniref:LysR family transcriptional regulator n=1 Tax=Cycloclasticus sp. TaxID=2024830 RepID=UPI00257AACCC|nr:LysR family transcriptional regulator [Cycloclasticus sp.]MBV1899627.1 LysR family transcriptional regulator [Cycloclasticus sp.]